MAAAPSVGVRTLASSACPSAPARPIVLADAPDRPQPRRDVHAGRGMSVVVGRVREDTLLDVKLVAMGHNTIRGAAGGSILNAELCVLGAPPMPAGLVGEITAAAGAPAS